MTKHFFTSIYSLYILFLSNILTVTSNDDIPTLKLNMYDYGYLTLSLDTKFINSEQKNVMLIENSQGKIAYIDSNDTFNNLTIINSLYNKRWYFYITTKDNFELILTQINPKEFYILGILLSQELVSQYNETSLPQTTIPLLNISSDNHTAIMQYDYKNQVYNTFFTLSQYREVKIYPTTYFLTIAIVSLLLSCGYFVLWFIKFKKLDQNHIIVLQRILIILPIAEVLVTITIFLEITVVSNSGENTYQIYIETALITLNAVYRTVLWFMISLVLFGWQITKQSLNREEMKFFLRVFILIYIAMCIDQIIDSVFIDISTVTASEIKNLIFYAYMLYWLTQKGVKSYKYLQRKLSYASIVSREYIPSLLMKMKMIR